MRVGGSARCRLVVGVVVIVSIIVVHLREVVGAAHERGGGSWAMAASALHLLLLSRSLLCEKRKASAAGPIRVNRTHGYSRITGYSTCGSESSGG